jgi:hypothetical protein
MASTGNQCFRPLGPPVNHGSPILQIVVADDGLSWTTSGTNGKFQTWAAPEPMTGTPDAIATRLEVETSMMFQHQTCVRLTEEQWLRRKQQSRPSR